jgi:hypothetical protein
VGKEGEFVYQNENTGTELKMAYWLYAIGRTNLEDTPFFSFPALPPIL